jgi:hypothetical protein
MITDHTPITHLNYPADIEQLNKSAAAALKFSKSYTDSRYPNLKMSDWLIGKYTDDHIEKIIRDFNVNGSPRFYWLEPDARIPIHVDNNTLCSINIILTPDPVPIIIDNVEYKYTQCLLDTTRPHGVINGPSSRILFKISIFDRTYHDLRQNIMFKINS